MTTRRWGHLLQQARTARSWGWPITVLLGHRAQDGRVTDRDRLIALALQHVEDSICPGCGQPHWKTDTDSGENVGRFEASAVLCGGCETRGDFEDEQRKAHGDTPPHGLRTVLADTQDPDYVDPLG